MNTFVFGGLVTNTEPDCPLSFSITLDGTEVFEKSVVTEPKNFSIEIPDDEQEHELRLVMSNKNKNDTVVDAQGNLVKNPMLDFKNLKFDNIDITLWTMANSVYTHDFNGTQSEIADSFGGCMGCNGEVVFKFTTPIYVWLMDVVM